MIGSNCSEIKGQQAGVRRTCIPVETVPRKLSTRISDEVILANHPRLTCDEILAAQSFPPIAFPTETRFRATARWLADKHIDAGLRLPEVKLLGQGGPFRPAVFFAN